MLLRTTTHFQIDVARHFRSKAEIIKLLDEMARIKLQPLHLSLTNDEGWRLEISALPELTEVGGRRCHDLSERTALLPQLGSGPSDESPGSSGYYSRAEYVEIVQAATIRGIEVIPEINMPAHARAAVVSMEARYHHFAEQGDDAAAKEYRLLDPDDGSICTSVQFYDRYAHYINVCALLLISIMTGPLQTLSSSSALKR